MTKTLILILTILTTFSGFSQGKCKQVLLIGSVEDSSNPQAFYNLMIVNRTKGRGVFGQPNGHFSVYVSDNDSVSISVKGYPIVGLRIHADSNCQYKFHAYIDPIAVEIKEVVITPLKTLNQIKDERQALAMRETRQVTGIEGLGSPITLLYQTFSQKEQNKRWIEEQKYKDNQRKIVQELLRLYVAYDIINLSNEQFDEFISFLNIDETFLKTATEMELITFVKDKFEHFRNMNSIQFDENYKWRSELELHNKKGALEELLRLYNAHGLIDLSETEFDRFITFSHIDEELMRKATDKELLSHVQGEYVRYIEFYKKNKVYTNLDFNITQYDTYLWRSELACKDNKKAAIKLLIKIYIEHGALKWNTIDKDYERFIQYLNLTESFMNKSTDDEVLTFVINKYEKYLDFYKLR